MYFQPMFLVGANMSHLATFDILDLASFGVLRLDNIVMAMVCKVHTNLPIHGILLAFSLFVIGIVSGYLILNVTFNQHDIKI